MLLYTAAHEASSRASVFGLELTFAKSPRTDSQADRVTASQANT